MHARSQSVRETFSALASADIQSTLKEKFLPYIHNFRGFAILMIVGVHCRTSIPWPAYSFTHELLFYGLDFATILFVFISGFLFEYLTSEKLNYPDYILKKAKYVLLPYVIVSVPALLDKLLIETDAQWMTPFYHSLAWPFKIIYMLMTGKHSGPFYFIPTIAVIFAIAPLLHYVQKAKAFTFVAAGILLAGLFSHHYGYYATISESVVYFLPVYIFGMWACKHRNFVVGINNVVLAGLIMLYLVIFYLELTHVADLARQKSFGPQVYFSLPFDWGKFRMIVLALILLNVFYRLRNTRMPVLATLGDYSFGIYFIHIYFINVIELSMHYFAIAIEQNILIFLIYLGFVIGASMLGVFVTKKVFGKNSRLVIGS